MIELMRPWAFFLLPLPWLAWRLLPAIAANAALPVPAPIRGLISGLSDQGQRRRQARPEDFWLKAVGWLLLVVAIAGPFSRDSNLLTPTGRDLMIAIDLSASMDEPDMEFDGATVPRYVVVRETLGDFIKARRGDRVGLIAWRRVLLDEDRISTIRHRRARENANGFARTDISLKGAASRRLPNDF